MKDRYTRREYRSLYRMLWQCGGGHLNTYLNVLHKARWKTLSNYQLWAALPRDQVAVLEEPLSSMPLYINETILVSEWDKKTYTTVRLEKPSFRALAARWRLQLGR